MDYTLPSTCPICTQIPNQAHGNLLPGSTEHLPEAVRLLRQDGQDFSVPGSGGEWDLQCPTCGCCYLMSCETGAFEYDVHVSRLTPIGARERGRMDGAACRQLLQALPGDLYHDEPEFRAYASASLARQYLQPDERNPDALRTLLRSPDEVVRSAALHEIRISDVEPFAEMLVDLLWDPSWQVHEAARYRLCPTRAPDQALRILSACQSKLVASVAARPLTYNVLRLLTDLEPLPLGEGLRPFLPRLVESLRTGELEASCAKDGWHLLARFSDRRVLNARALLSALNGVGGAPLSKSLMELRARAEERSQRLD